MAYQIAGYEGLQAVIARQSGGSSDPEFAEGIREAIYLAESAMNTNLRVPEMMVRLRATVNERWESLPPNFLEMRQAWWVDSYDPTLDDPLDADAVESGTDIPLRPTTPERIAHYSRFIGNPKAITVVGGQYRIEPRATPDTEYRVRLWYYTKVPPLSDDNPNTTILDRYPELYLNGALSQLGSWLAGDPRLEMWAGLFAQGIEAANHAAGRTARMRSFAA